MRRWLCSILVLLAAAGQTARAEQLYCFEQAAAYYQVPVILLKAIARHESGMNPKIIHENKDGSKDIGLMQINEWWLPKLKELGIERADLFDPCVNTYVGAWVLAQNIRLTDDLWLAVGAYNAGWRPGKEREERRKWYAERIRNQVISLQDQQLQQMEEGES